MKIGNVYVHYIPDCGENTGGYYCEVYSDEDMEDQIDSFCIHPDDCDCTNEDEVVRYIKEYLEFGQFWDSIE